MRREAGREAGGEHRRTPSAMSLALVVLLASVLLVLPSGSAPPTGVAVAAERDSGAAGAPAGVRFAAERDSGAAGAPAVPGKRRWLADVREAMSGARRYVDRRVRLGGRQLAVNLDIDNTSLATYYDRGAPVAVVLRFARHARSKGVDLVFNTGRLTGEGRMRHARRTLTRAGYRVSELCGRRSGEALAESKQRCRRGFVEEGYTLIANAGNTPTDFVGGNYERAYRLPSYGGRLG